MALALGGGGGGGVTNNINSTPYQKGLDKDGRFSLNNFVIYSSIYKLINIYIVKNIAQSLNKNYELVKLKQFCVYYYLICYNM